MVTPKTGDLLLQSTGDFINNGKGGKGIFPNIFISKSAVSCTLQLTCFCLFWCWRWNLGSAHAKHMFSHCVPTVCFWCWSLGPTQVPTPSLGCTWGSYLWGNLTESPWSSKAQWQCSGRTAAGALSWPVHKDRSCLPILWWEQPSFDLHVLGSEHQLCDFRQVTAPFCFPIYEKGNEYLTL